MLLTVNPENDVSMILTHNGDKYHEEADACPRRLDDWEWLKSRLGSLKELGVDHIRMWDLSIDDILFLLAYAGERATDAEIEEFITEINNTWASHRPWGAVTECKAVVPPMGMEDTLRFVAEVDGVTVCWDFQMGTHNGITDLTPSVELTETEQAVRARDEKVIKAVLDEIAKLCPPFMAARVSKPGAVPETEHVHDYLEDCPEDDNNGFDDDYRQTMLDAAEK